MMPYRESKISAHHNYLVNAILTPGFVVGDPNSEKGFYFLADLVLPGESTPRISTRITDDHGMVLLELSWNRIRENQGGYTHQSVEGGFRILQPSGKLLFEVCTRSFPKGHLTRITGTVVDEKGRIRMEPLGESIRVYGKAELVLETPFVFSRSKGDFP
jgi:hypothetical protein